MTALTHNQAPLVLISREPEDDTNRAIAAAASASASSGPKTAAIFRHAAHPPGETKNSATFEGAHVEFAR
jgi:hypothetical protein